MEVVNEYKVHNLQNIVTVQPTTIMFSQLADLKKEAY